MDAQPAASPLWSAPASSLSVPQPSTQLEQLLEQLQQGSFQTRWDAAKALVNFGLEAIEPLIQILQAELELDEDADWDLLWFIARILGDLNQVAAIPALIDLLQTADNPELTGVVATALANFGESAIVPLTALLSDTRTRLAALQTLAQIHHSQVVPLLLQQVADPNSTIRIVAIEALGQFYDPQIPPALMQALHDTTAAVRRSAVVSLGLQSSYVQAQQPELELVALVQPLLYDLNLEVCRQAAATLGRIGTIEAATALFRALEAQTPEPLQIEIVRSLVWIQRPEALIFLERILSVAAPHLAVEIVAGLGRIESSELQKHATQILLKLFDDQHPISQTIKGKQTIALSLAQLQQPEALEALLNLLADADAGVRLHTIAALKQLDLKTSRQRLTDLLQQTDLTAAMREGATIALQEWHRSDSIDPNLSVE